MLMINSRAKMMGDNFQQAILTQLLVSVLICLLVAFGMVANVEMSISMVFGDWMPMKGSSGKE